MRRAQRLLAMLQDSKNELIFIRGIVNAIEEEQWAIFTQILATLNPKLKYNVYVILDSTQTLTKEIPNFKVIYAQKTAEEGSWKKENYNWDKIWAEIMK